MDFDWNAANRSHIAAHGIAAEEAEQVIQNGPIDITLQNRGGEWRLVQLGETDQHRLLVVTTWRGNKVRVVTAFSANQRMKKIYREHREPAHDQGTEDSEV